MVAREIISNSIKSTTIRFSIITYLAIGLNVVSGVFLARSLGAAERGVLAYYANFLLLSSIVTASNISNATARTLVNNTSPARNLLKSNKRSFLYLGFIMAAICAYLVGVLAISDWRINRNYFIILILANAFAALISAYDGYWRFNNSIRFLTWSRFIGLAAPSLFTITLIATGHAEIKYLLLGQLVVSIMSLGLILLFASRNPQIQLPESKIIFKSALYGFPTYIAEYLSSWIVPFLILSVEGDEVLGWYVVAMSYSLLADVTYSALEAKNYRFMTTFSKYDVPPTLKLFIRNASPILGMHVVFIPLVFLIPIIYGQEFANSSVFAVAILLIRIPIVISRSITSYLISTSQNLKSFIILLSFLITFSTVILWSQVKLFQFYWIFAYACGAVAMLLCGLLFLFERLLKNQNL
jgi:O-antigen/teichoic acid export membrane protein